MNQFATTSLILAVCFCARTVSAQAANYESVPVGGRGAAMGGAFVALADDGSATFYNPAGLASIRKRGISLSATAYGIRNTTVTGFIRAGAESIDLEESSLLIFPTATSYVLPLEPIAGLNHAAAFSIIVPHNDNFEGTQNLSLTESFLDLDIFQARARQVMWAGPSYGIGGDRLQVGASLMLQYASFNEKNALSLGLTVDDPATGESITVQSAGFEQRSGSAFGLMPSLGAQYRVDDRFVIGVALRLPVIHVTGSSETFYTNAESTLLADAAGDPLPADAVYQDTYRKVEADFVEHAPLMLGAGCAYEAPSDLRIAFDTRAYLPVSRYSRIEGDPVDPNPDLPGEYGETATFDPTEIDPGHAFVINFSAGIEAPITESLYLLGGFHTDFSSIREEDLFLVDDVRIDMYHFTAGARSVSDSGSLIVGLAFAIGAGEAAGLDFADLEDPDVRADASRWSLGVFMAGTAFLGEDPEDSAAQTQPAPVGGQEESGDFDEPDGGPPP